MEKIKEISDTLSARLSEKKITAISGGGMVEVVCNGKKDVIDIKIDEEAKEDLEMLSVLILSAISSCQKKAEDVLTEEMKEMVRELSLGITEEDISNK